MANFTGSSAGRPTKFESDLIDEIHKNMGY
jgi:hypothetical protein